MNNTEFRYFLDMHMSGIKNFAIFPKSRKLAKFNKARHFLL